MVWSWIILGTALALSTALLVDASRHQILGRMARRNVVRRPKQTATVIAGLMIGTAIISASLVAGQSAGSAIRGAVFENLGEIDETVRTDGFNFFPEEVAQAIIDDPDVAALTDAGAPFILWDGAVEHPSGLFQPSVRVFGFDVQQDQGFGSFGLVGGGHHDGAIATGEVIINDGLADELDAQVGDTLTLATTLPQDPLLPQIQVIAGALTGASPTLPIGPTPSPTQEVHTFDVPVGAKRLTAIFVCGNLEQGCTDPSQVRITFTAPDGTTDGFRRDAGPPCASSCPPSLTWFNLTTAPTEVLQPGQWTVTITAELAANTPFALPLLIMQPVYDLDELARRAEALRDQAADLFDDQLDLFGDRVETTVRVAAIADSGRADQFGFPHAMFMPLPDVQRFLQREGQVNFVKLSNNGDIAEGARLSDEAERAINGSLVRAGAMFPGLTVVDHLSVNPVKQTFLALADEAGELMTSLLIFAGSLTIITGLLLIINIFTMLAEERRSELGMARAVGLRRSDVVRLFLYEGSLYGAGAAFIGSLLGLGLAYILIEILNGILVRVEAAFPPIPFYVPGWVIPVAFSAGLLLTFTTIAFASARQSRLNIVRAIRQIEEPENQRNPWAHRLGLPLVAVGLAAGITGWIILAGQNRDPSFLPSIPAFSLTVFGPLVAGIGVMMRLRERFRRAPLYTSVALSLSAYYVATIFLITEFPSVREANIVGPIRGVLMTLGIVMAISFWRTGPRILGRALARFKRLRAVAIPAVSYPQHKRFRTGMTLAMFSVVILSIGFFSIFGALFDLPAERQTGGFHIEATTTLDVPDIDGLATEPVQGITGQYRLRDWWSFDPSFITVSGERTGQFGEPGHHVFGVEQDFIDAQSFRLLWTADGLDEAATYQRLMDEPGTVIVSYPYSTDERNNDLAHEVGETLRIHTGECTVAADDCPSYQIIGIQEQYHHLGIFLPQAEVDRLFPQADALYLFTVDEPSRAADIAKDLERAYRSIGMDAKSSIDEVEKEQEGFRQILAAMKLFLSLGLIVGVLSLGIVTSRSVLERRQEIGMLRALGYTRRQVRRIFLIEVTMVIAMGFVVGFLCSVIVTYGLWFAVIRELQYPYTIPWVEVFYLFLASYIVAMMATVAPILRVGKVAPAEALRYVE